MVSSFAAEPVFKAGTLDPLRADALVLEAGEKKLAIVRHHHQVIEVLRV